MKSTSSSDRSDQKEVQIKEKALYTKPAVQPAGSVFSRTKALGGGTKDGLSGSSIL